MNAWGAQWLVILLELRNWIFSPSECIKCTKMHEYSSSWTCNLGNHYTYIFMIISSKHLYFFMCLVNLIFIILPHGTPKVLARDFHPTWSLDVPGSIRVSRFIYAHLLPCPFELPGSPCFSVAHFGFPYFYLERCPIFYKIPGLRKILFWSLLQPVSMFKNLNRENTILKPTLVCFVGLNPNWKISPWSLLWPFYYFKLELLE